MPVCGVCACAASFAAFGFTDVRSRNQDDSWTVVAVCVNWNVDCALAGEWDDSRYRQLRLELDPSAELYFGDVFAECGDVTFDGVCAWDRSDDGRDLCDDGSCDGN